MKTPVFFIGEELSGKTRQWLKKRHIQYIEEPFFKIDYKKPNLQLFSAVAHQRKQWVITSSYAAHWFVRFKSQLGLTGSDKVFCWSEKQADILQTTDLPIAVSSFGNHLEITSSVIAQNRGETILFLHGDQLHSEINSIFLATGIPFLEFNAYKNTPVEKMVNGIFDAYLFFSSAAIDRFKASGNFPHPNSLILANENSTARAAWRVFTNKVCLSPEPEELLFVQYSISRWMEENKK